MKKLFLIIFILLLSACAVGPDYVRPKAKTPYQFKEKSKNWRIAKPNDNFNRGQWWTIFHNSELNALEEKLNINNQNIAVALAQYQQAYALVDQARAAFYPSLTMAASITRQRQVNPGANAATTATSTSTSTGGVTTTTLGSSKAGVSTTHSLLASASWVPDFWGLVRRQVESSTANAQSSYALLSLARLSAQASLAQYYFELRGLDKDQELLDKTVVNYEKILKIVLNQYNSGTAGRADVVQAQAQLEAQRALAINNGVNRAVYEHAIAVLIGEPPSVVSLRHRIINTPIPDIPVMVPSELLERRPDIASAERLMAQTNAEVGVAVAAFFPSITLSASASVQHQGLEKWFSYPLMNWALGPQLTETLLDGGQRWAAICAAKATYRAQVATYKQTVLAAFQNVEDNLSTLRILNKQQIADNRAASDARYALKLVINEYRSGTVPFSSVLTAANAAFAAEKTAADVKYLRLSSAVGLVQSLGGGWNSYGIERTCQFR